VNAVARAMTSIQALLKSYGPTAIKRLLWNREYSGPKWDFADHTSGDVIYPILEKYCRGGSVLDLGCGSGNTATELNVAAYDTYLGVDISEEALAKARRRSEVCGRAIKNSFLVADIVSFRPATSFDVILFRESLYHVPMGRIDDVLRGYSAYLKEGGVLIVRLQTWDQDGNQKTRPGAMIRMLESGYRVVEKVEHRASKATVIVVQPAPGFAT